MTRTDARPILLDLADELLVASTLLAMMEAKGGNKPELLEMATFSVARCQELVESMVRIDRHSG